MRTERVLKITALVLACSMVAMAPVLATTGAGDPVVNKLGRGLSNGLTGWMELPYHIQTDFRGDNPVESFVVGTVRGTVLGVGRMAVGVIETGTFFLPIPANYEPIMYDPQYFAS